MFRLISVVSMGHEMFMDKSNHLCIVVILFALLSCYISVSLHCIYRYLITDANSLVWSV